MHPHGAAWAQRDDRVGLHIGLRFQIETIISRQASELYACLRPSNSVAQALARAAAERKVRELRERRRGQPALGPKPVRLAEVLR